MLISLGRRTENVRVETVIIAELKFSNVQRHVLGDDLAERANDSALWSRIIVFQDATGTDTPGPTEPLSGSSPASGFCPTSESPSPADLSRAYPACN
jgi:hypothetical protein